MNASWSANNFARNCRTVQRSKLTLFFNFPDSHLQLLLHVWCIHVCEMYLKSENP